MIKLFKKSKYLLLIITILGFGLFNFRDVQTDNVKRKIVKYAGDDLMISIDGVASSNLPTSGNYYLADYDCKNVNTVLEWNSSTYELSVTNGNKKGGVACYLEFETNPKLADMPVGSYVSYTGDNGCTGESCSGQNANYISDTDMGHCGSTNYKYTANGWRIAYTKDRTAYLVSAGSPECLCTNLDGTMSNSSCSSSDVSKDLALHATNLNKQALKYCNEDYVYGGTCSTNNEVRNFNAEDFKIMTGSDLVNNACNSVTTDKKCGYTNDLIDIGSYYWINTAAVTSNLFNWSPMVRAVTDTYSQNVNGLRPVIRFEPTVVVTGGTGTYDDPYTISNNTFWINDGATEISNADKTEVNISLISVNASKMCISTNTSVCTNYVDFDTSYTLDWSNEEAGEKVVYVYYKNESGSIIATINRSIILLDK